MFPKNFLWGASTSSHQVEGNNIYNDWWLWEQDGKTEEPSAAATDHYELFDQDFRLASKLKHNAHRFSIEWSRIEPQQDVFSEEALDHYRHVIQTLKSYSIEPIVTLHHFTLPVWFQEQNGWLNSTSPEIFTNYIKKTVESLGQDIRYWITINEPMILGYYGYLTGIWPPGLKSAFKTFQAVKNMIKAHKGAYDCIHDRYKENTWKNPSVGIAKNLRPFSVCPQTPNIFSKLGVALRHYAFNQYVLDCIRAKMDFIGVNYYESEFISNDSSHSFGILGGNCNQVHQHGQHYNQMGWMYSPDGLLKILKWVNRYHKNLLITENGTAEDDDQFRQTFIIEHLEQCQKALQDGIPLLGYLHWSLLDNFEWHHGFKPRFGLIEVDYQTQERKVRSSAIRFKEIIEGKSLK